jgi:hypothetical protein
MAFKQSSWSAPRKIPSPRRCVAWRIAWGGDQEKCLIPRCQYFYMLSPKLIMPWQNWVKCYGLVLTVCNSVQAGTIKSNKVSKNFKQIQESNDTKFFIYYTFLINGKFKGENHQKNSIFSKNMYYMINLVSFYSWICDEFFETWIDLFYQVWYEFDTTNKP